MIGMRCDCVRFGLCFGSAVSGYAVAVTATRGLRRELKRMFRASRCMKPVREARRACTACSTVRIAREGFDLSTLPSAQPFRFYRIPVGFQRLHRSSGLQLQRLLATLATRQHPSVHGGPRARRPWGLERSIHPSTHPPIHPFTSTSTSTTISTLYP